jgi:hypothetical protein
VFFINLLRLNKHPLYPVPPRTGLHRLTSGNGVMS